MKPLLRYFNFLKRPYGTTLPLNPDIAQIPSPPSLLAFVRKNLMKEIAFGPPRRWPGI